MADIENKNEKIVKKISIAIEKLDADINKINNLMEESSKKHSLKKWIAEKKAIHEIKKILHEENKYEKYKNKEQEEQLAKEIKKIDNFLS